MKSKKLKIAVIGTGLIGPRHCDTVKRSLNAILVAIVDLAPHGEALATSLGTKHYASIKLLLESPDKPDAAIVCTPNHSHVALTKELASASVHVLVEKPVSTDIASGRTLIEAARSTGVKILVGQHRRFNPYVRATKEAIQSQLLGDITAVNGLWCLIKPLDYFDSPTEWRRSSSVGVMLMNLIRDIDVLRYLLGPIIRVYAEKALSRRGYDADEGAAITFKFKSGVVGTFLVMDNVPSPFNFESGTGENPMIPKTCANFYRIFGTEGVLSIPEMTIWTCKGGEKSWTAGFDKISLHVEDAVAFDLQLEHFVSAVSGQEELVCPVEDGLETLIVCEAVRKAMQQGTTLDLDDSIII